MTTAMSGSSFQPRIGKVLARDARGRRFDPNLRDLLTGHGNPDPLASELILTLLGTNRLMVDAMEAVAAAHGLSMSRFGVLIRLWRAARPLPLHEIADLCDTTPRNVTGLIDGLETVGLVIRRTTPGDRRVTLVELTGPGRELIEDHLPDHWEIQRRLCAGLGEEERRTLIDLCLRLTESRDHGTSEATAVAGRPPTHKHLSPNRA